jgi:hypothetical protein
LFRTGLLPGRRVPVQAAHPAIYVNGRRQIHIVVGVFILRLLPAAMAFRTPQVMCRAHQAHFEAVRVIMNLGFSSVSINLM